MNKNFSRKDMKSFADWCRNGLTNMEYSVDELDKHLDDWELHINNKPSKSKIINLKQHSINNMINNLVNLNKKL
tara:strand:+ start:92 stop:313 length:222 start_codon:yes stop_codon:yes gene_type:complete